MYSLLIVDDEPIVLSGIKFLIDWETEDLSLVGTARNGRQALELIEERPPDIVVCDINMPVMTGLELLRAVAEKPWAPVFIMLTNYEEFDMARDSLRYHAVDYLLKSQLEPETLANALRLAKAACDRRAAVSDASAARRALGENRSRIVSSCARRLFLSDDTAEAVQYNTALLENNGVLHNFCILQIFFDYTSIPHLETYSPEDIRRIYESERELLETLLPKVQRGFALFSPDDLNNSFGVYCWDVQPALFEKGLPQLFAKLAMNSGVLTPAHVSLACTQSFSGAPAVLPAVRKARALREHYYLYGGDFISADACSEPAQPRQPLSPDALCNKLMVAIRSRNQEQCAQLFARARAVLQDTPHTRRAGTEYCAQLYTTAATALIPLLAEYALEQAPPSIAVTVRYIHSLIGRSQLLAWLDVFSAQVQQALQLCDEPRSHLLGNVRRYILENMEKRIMLQDVAEYVHMAPTYLSTTFKKQYNKNLVDYINETKIERACMLLRDGSHKIYETAYLLGYENAYYFTKVFKRYVGMTPKEYQASQKRRPVSDPETAAR